MLNVINSAIVTIIQCCHPTHVSNTGRTSKHALAICTKPLARQGVLLWYLDRVLDTEGGVHDRSTPAYAGGSPAAELLRAHSPPLHAHRCRVRKILPQVARSAGSRTCSDVSSASAQRAEACMGNDPGSTVGSEVPLHADTEADLVRSGSYQAQGAAQASYSLEP